jgi:SAM-dependent methyltransferase
MDRREHWTNVYRTKDHTKVGWFQPAAEISLALFDKIGITAEASVIDIGAGASTLVDGLLARGYKNITLLDISEEALELVKERLGDENNIPEYLIEDITTASLLNRYTLWHDRAAFHFLLNEEEQRAYVRTMYDSLDAEGYAIIGTFALNGPDTCSALPVQQYDRTRMARVLDNRFTIIDVVENTHVTPSGSEQNFCFFILQPVKSK